MPDSENDPSMEEEAFRQSILSEIAERKTKNPKDWHTYFNNFRQYAPDPTMPGGSMWRWMIGQLPEGGNRRIVDKRFSALRRSQTALEFQETVDKVIEELGLKDQLTELMRRYQEAERRTEEQDQRLQELQEALIPVFIKLRYIGYTQTDLIT